MGCNKSKSQGSKASPTTNAGKPTAAPPPPKKKLDPKDYIIKDRSGEVITKEEGTINGEQFNIEGCKDCDIFLFDTIAQSFVDECERCRIFVGPVASSIFLRNCTGCSMVIACQQYRCRDCTDCRIALLCTTEPVIETSTKMQFACFDFGYFSLREQLSRSQINVLNNKWWQVHDFNKNADNPNWDLLPQAKVPGDVLNLSLCNGISQEELAMDRVVPITLGCRERPSQELCMILFLPDSDAFIEAFVAKAAKTESWTLCRSRSTALSEDRVKTLFAWTPEKLWPRCKGKEVTGIELCGAGIVKEVQAALEGTGLAAGSKSIRLVPDDKAAMLGKAFFEVWKDEI